MKPPRKQILDLAARIDSARQRQSYSFANLGKSSGVDPSQVSRICRGEFRTVSANVMQICMTLGLTISDKPVEKSMDVIWNDVEVSLLKLWDKTPEGAAAIARVLDAIAALKPRD